MTMVVSRMKVSSASSLDCRDTQD